MIGCGGSSKTTTVPSGVTNRAFVSNAYLGSSYNGLVHVLDATKDEISGYVSAGTSPGLMEVSSDREITVVFDSSSNSVVVVTNDTEQAAGGL
jgi:DNA-binding beta-propeller fold protein YncE